MAKDGTARGGARIGAGRKKSSYDERKIGEEANSEKISYAESSFEILPPKEYLTAEQKGGGKLIAEQIYQETYIWLKSVGCASIVTKQLVENYAQMQARHIYCEELLSKFGLLAKHPTTGEPTTSPFVKMSIDYSKQANQIWCQIYQIVKENSAKGQLGITAQSEAMENILRRVK